MVIGFQKREGIHYISNFYRYKLFDKETKHYLLTTDDGNSLFLNSSSFRQLKKGRLEDENLYNILLSKGIIVNETNFNNVVEKTRKRYSFIGNGTSLHIIVPTHRCNMGCVYCFAEAENIENQSIKDMTSETAKKTVEFIMKSPSDAITIEFQGGEPLLGFENIKIIVKYAKELNRKYCKDLKFALVSNFTLMTEGMAEWFIENGVSFCTSLDGPREVHDNNRPILAKNKIKVGTYDKVAYWIKKINSMYKKKGVEGHVNAIMTITKESLPYFKEIIDEYVKFGIYLVNIRPLTMMGRVKDTRNGISYDMKDFICFYQDSLKYIDSLNRVGIFVVDRIRDLYNLKIIENKPGYHADFESPCGAATGNIVYFTDGSIYTCNEALGRDEFKLGNVYEDKWSDIFKKNETAKAILNSMIESNVMCDRCVYKPYCSTCMVENFYSEGKFHFYPTKTSRHHQTIMHSENFFNNIFNELKKKL